MNTFEVGQWLVCADENSLSPVAGVDIDAQTLLPKVMTLLLYFIENPNRLLTFDELNQAVWPKEVVGDNAIYNLIGQLRKVLGDKASKPQYIETLSKKGYRLIAPVKLISNKPITKSAPKTISKKRRLIELMIGLIGVIYLVYSVLDETLGGLTIIYSAEQLPDLPRQHFTLAMFHQHKHSQKNTKKCRIT